MTLTEKLRSNKKIRIAIFLLTDKNNKKRTETYELDLKAKGLKDFIKKYVVDRTITSDRCVFYLCDLT